VVGDGDPCPTYEEIIEFTERKHIHLVGSFDKYVKEDYERSVIPLLEYSGGHNWPEVLIPFPVKARVVSRVELLFLKLKAMVCRHGLHGKSLYCWIIAG
jgi:hypothetical protein